MKLDFGTAGIRGIVGDNETQLNEIHVARVFDGFAKYLLSTYNDVKEKGIVIGRDNRVKGKLFANIAAKILTSYGIKIYFNNEMLPTPFISFLTRVKKARGAINITASHNPREYNGIKIYDCNGCQMLPDEVNEMKLYFLPYENYVDYKNLSLREINIDKKMINLITEKDYDEYLKEVTKINFDKNDLSNLKIVYSPLHGTGYPFIKKLFDQTRATVHYEPNEIIEDENFSAIESPNPEHKIAFKNTINLANEKGADIVLVTDPDSDRVGVAIKEGNDFKLLNGNEIAILITNYLIDVKPRNKEKPNYLVYSFVSTSLPAKMCQENGIKSYVTETGFKWIGNKIDELKNNEEFFFAFEESYGSLINEEISHDKDAIQSLFAIALVASNAKKQNQSLIGNLESIYKKYGYVKAKSFSFDLIDQNQLENIKQKFKQLLFENTKLIDYNEGHEGIKADMLTYEFADNVSWISLRPSGTEPKFKIYIHIIDLIEKQAEKNFNFYFEKIKTILE